MSKGYISVLVTAIVCRLLGVVTVFAFTYQMVVFTNRLGCLWLLLLLFAVELIPVYEFKYNNSENKEK